MISSASSIIVDSGGSVFENRRNPRVPLDVAVEFVASGVETRVQARAKDISLGGIFFETSAPMAYSDKLVVYVTIPGEKAPFALSGTVRWVGPTGMGVQFDSMGAKETYSITEYAKSLVPAAAR
jgi:type IV pilus assembly protein PilZ